MWPGRGRGPTHDVPLGRRRGRITAAAAPPPAAAAARGRRDLREPYRSRARAADPRAGAGAPASTAS
jgi:hypothetical protein